MFIGFWRLNDDGNMQLTRRRVTHIHSLAARKAVLSSGSASCSVSRKPTGFNGHPIGDLGKSRRPNAWRSWKSCDRMHMDSYCRAAAVGTHLACCLAIGDHKRCLNCDASVSVVSRTEQVMMLSEFGEGASRLDHCKSRAVSDEAIRPPNHSL